ncbi:PUA-like domain-containing protein [Phycomyces nitens]|nr:PUA-like domain-containing protein [Phycomyces nitens]
MAITLFVPFHNPKKNILDVTVNEKVSAVRKLIAKKFALDLHSFRLIALGKVLEDNCADGSPATLFVTYKIRNNSQVILHLKDKSADQTEIPEPVSRETSVSPQTTPQAIPQENPQDQPEDSGPSDTANKEIEPYACKTCCNDDTKLECNECGCKKCLLKSGNPLICDQCEEYWHIECAGLTEEPKEDDWYCPECINTDVDAVVGAGKSVDIRNTKAAKSNAAKQTKKWGGGVSCSGRDSECIVVPKTHVGHIPGIRCGQSWTYRMKCSEWGIHRSPVGGISGATKSGAVSVVLSGGYEDDKDNGEEFFYTGSGGRDLEGNKRLGDHCGDQELTRFNLALAKTCAAKIDSTVGAEAEDWTKSRPIRVCRTSNLAKHNPEYAPESGVRYDGLYKIVKYWPDTGKSGHRVWRYLFRRDDTEPAPWTEAGKRIVDQHGVRLIAQDTDKIEKLVLYKIPEHIEALIAKDKADKRVWDDLRKMEFWSEYEFLHNLFSSSIVCSSGACAFPIKDPVTTPCGHICCLKCLEQKDFVSCFSCRSDLSEFKRNGYSVNKELEDVLKAFNWAYGVDTNMPLPSEKSSPRVKKVDVKEKPRAVRKSNLAQTDIAPSPKRARRSLIRKVGDVKKDM